MSGPVWRSPLPLSWVWCGATVNSVLASQLKENRSPLIGSVASNPYTFTWSNAAPGASYSLTVVVSDGDGSTTSPPVAFVYPLVDAGRDRTLGLPDHFGNYRLNKFFPHPGT